MGAKKISITEIESVLRDGPATAEEIAETLKANVGTVRCQLHRAHAQHRVGVHSKIKNGYLGRGRIYRWELR